MTHEQRIRAYASHLALRVLGPKGGPFTLVEKYARVGGPNGPIALRARGPKGGPLVEGPNGPVTLAEKYDAKRRRVGGPYRSLAQLERGIDRYGARELKRLEAEG
jgi:hypothetical protein